MCPELVNLNSQREKINFKIRCCGLMISVLKNTESSEAIENSIYFPSVIVRGGRWTEVKEVWLLLPSSAIFSILQFMSPVCQLIAFFISFGFCSNYFYGTLNFGEKTLKGPAGLILGVCFFSLRGAYLFVL